MLASGEAAWPVILLQPLLILTAVPAGRAKAGNATKGDTESPDPETSAEIVGDGSEGWRATTQVAFWDGVADVNVSTLLKSIPNSTWPIDDADSGTGFGFIEILIALGVLLLVALVIVGFALRSWRKKNLSNASGKEERPLTRSTTEYTDLPSPKFEDDVPSVLELEMEDVENWTIKNGHSLAADAETETT